MLPEKLRTRIEETLARLPEVEAQLEDPAVLADPQAVQRLGKQHAELSELKDLYTRYQQAEQSLHEAQEILETSEDADDAPDVEVVAFVQAFGHHDDIGGAVPGSMPSHASGRRRGRGAPSAPPTSCQRNATLTSA